MSLIGHDGDFGGRSDYEVFVRTVTEGSLSGAARALNLSPAVISKRLARLEEHLGVTLILRTTRRAALTDAGQIFFERATRILRDVAEAEGLVSSFSRSTGGLLRVSAPTSFGRMHIAGQLKAFLDDHPDIRLELNLTDDLVDMVMTGTDVAVRITAPGDDKVIAHQLAPNHRYLCATPAYLAAHGTPQSLEDLRDHRLLAAISQSPWQIYGPDGRTTLPVASFIRTNSSEVVREAMMAGMGIALRSTWDVSAEIASGALSIILPAYGSAPEIGIFAVQPAQRAPSPNSRAFIHYLQKLYGPTPYWDQPLGILPKAG